MPTDLPSREKNARLGQLSFENPDVPVTLIGIGLATGLCILSICVVVFVGLL